MKNNVLIVFALVCMISVAGCSGVLNIDEPDVEEYPDGYDANSINSSSAVSAHIEGLRTARSYESHSIQVVEEGNDSIQFISVAAVNLDTSEQLRTLKYNSSKTTRYTPDGDTEYLRYNEDNSDEPEYGVYEEGTSDTMHVRVLRPIISYIDYQVVSTTQANETTLITYEGSISTIDKFLSRVDNEGVDNIHSTVTVDENGIIRTFHFSGTLIEDNAPNTHTNLEITFTNIGNTTIQEPDWVDKAIEDAD